MQHATTKVLAMVRCPTHHSSMAIYTWNFLKSETAEGVKVCTHSHSHYLCTLDHPTPPSTPPHKLPSSNRYGEAQTQLEPQQ